MLEQAAACTKITGGTVTEAIQNINYNMKPGHAAANKAVCGPESSMEEKLTQLMPDSPIIAAHINLNADSGSVTVKINPLGEKLLDEREIKPARTANGLQAGPFFQAEEPTGQITGKSENLSTNAISGFMETKLDIAKHTELLDLLSSLGYTLKRIGSYYTTAEMDSVRIRDLVGWKRCSTRQGGDAISFLQKFCGMRFPEAVDYLLDMTWKEVVGVDTKLHVQTVTLPSDTDNVEKILQTLDAEVEATTEDGYTRTLHLLRYFPSYPPRGPGKHRCPDGPRRLRRFPAASSPECSNGIPARPPAHTRAVPARR